MTADGRGQPPDGPGRALEEMRPILDRLPSVSGDESAAVTVDILQRMDRWFELFGMPKTASESYGPDGWRPPRSMAERLTPDRAPVRQHGRRRTHRTGADDDCPRARRVDRRRRGLWLRTSGRSSASGRQAQADGVSVFFEEAVRPVAGEKAEEADVELLECRVGPCRDT